MIHDPTGQFPKTFVAFAAERRVTDNSNEWVRRHYQEGEYQPVYRTAMDDARNVGARGSAIDFYTDHPYVDRLYVATFLLAGVGEMPVAVKPVRSITSRRRVDARER